MRRAGGIGKRHHRARRLERERPPVLKGHAERLAFSMNLGPCGKGRVRGQPRKEVGVCDHAKRKAPEEARSDGAEASRRAQPGERHEEREARSDRDTTLHRAGDRRGARGLPADRPGADRSKWQGDAGRRQADVMSNQRAQRERPEHHRG